MASPISRPKALVVEDDASIRELLRFHLDLAGFAIEEAGDGRQGLERARADTFALILLDIMLPGLDGISLCRAVRGDGPNAATPILMLTARDGEADTVLSRAALLRGVWSGDTYVTERTVDAVVSRIRPKIERDPQDPELLLTAWGTGYKFVDKELGSRLRVRTTAGDRSRTPYGRVHWSRLSCRRGDPRSP